MTYPKLVKDYLPDWLPIHVQRHEAAHPAYPRPGEEKYPGLFSDWFDELRKNNISGDEAEAASKALLTHKEAAFRNNHLRLLRDIVEEARKTALEGEPVIIDAARAMAEIRSKDCPECEGSGFARRVGLDGEPIRVVTSIGKVHDAEYVTAACRCSLGRWFLAAAKKGEKPIDLLAIQATTLSWHDWYMSRPLPAPLDRHPRPTPSIKRIFDDTPFVD